MYFDPLSFIHYIVLPERHVFNSGMTMIAIKYFMVLSRVIQSNRAGQRVTIGTKRL